MTSSHKDLLRFATVGSVDDGKSTLIGRLLYETSSILRDQIEALETASKKLNRGTLDLSLITDGLRAEREQGITIDVAYRYFTTQKRRYIIADTPGHEQYTRNMVTGASTANLIILLIDAKLGIQTQSKRHAFISSLLGIPNVIVAINKMDLVDYSEQRYLELCEEYRSFCARLQLGSLQFIPISALIGDNIVNRGDNMPWYTGPTVHESLENTYVGGNTNLVDLRLPVQLVLRPDSTFRGYAGQVASGVIRKGESVSILPSNHTSKVKSLVTYEGEVDYAFAPQAITVVLEDELDISRGDVIVHSGNLPKVIREGQAILVWMSEDPLRTGHPYFLKLGANTVRAVIPEIVFRFDPNHLHREAAETLELNEIGRVKLETFKPLVCDEFSKNRQTGSFVIIDPSTFSTVAAGMIIDRGQGRQLLSNNSSATEPVSKNIVATAGGILRSDRERLLGQKSVTIWLTGLSGSGKSTVAYAIETELASAGHLAYVIDGDNVRHGLNRDLGFSPNDRKENIRRVAEVATLLNDAGVIVISSFISPYEEDRQSAGQIIGDGFIEVFIDAPIEVCENRDPKGLYKKARAGEISEFTGVSAPYEAPSNPDLHLKTDQMTPEESALKILEFLREGGKLH